MWVVSFMRSAPGRVLRVALGLWLIAYGATHPSLAGLVLMMVGVVPLDRYTARYANFVLVVWPAESRIAGLGARSAPRDTGNQPRALP